MTKIIISVHFPKAAGSSLAAAFRSHIGDNLLLDYGTDPVDPLHIRNIAPHLYPIESSKIPKEIRVIHGHFHINKYSNIINAYRVTFLRDPLDNLLSIYYFWRSCVINNSHEIYNTFKTISPNIFEFAEFPSLKMLMSKTYFGDVVMDRFNFIGFYDRRSADLARLSYEIGMDIDASIHINSTSRDEHDLRETIMADSKAIQRLRSSLADDLAFYNRLREKWN